MPVQASKQTLEQRIAELDATLDRLRSCHRQGTPPVPPAHYALRPRLRH